MDLVFAVLLCLALYKGLKNGLFVEVASLVALIVGIFLALNFSFLVQGVLETKVSWNPKYIQIVAFGLTFLLVVIGIYLSAKLLTKMADFAQLGWMNKLAGAFFSVLKTILTLSVVILFFEKINVNHTLIEQETLDNSVFYNPIKEVSAFIYPQIETIYESLKETVESEG